MEETKRSSEKGKKLEEAEEENWRIRKRKISYEVSDFKDGKELILEGKAEDGGEERKIK